MIRPNFQEEKKLQKRGFKKVVGLDEAGRGPLAGPVAAAAVVVDFRFKINDSSLLKEVNDSKKLSPRKREELYGLIIKNKNIKWGIGIVSEKMIDKINIKKAAELAMKKALQNLKPKNQNLKKKADFLIFDKGVNLDLKIPGRAILNADGKIFSVAAASILAKVARDRIMRRYHKKYPQYRFDLHKGYGTKLHLALLKRHGPCQIHRRSFGPVAKALSY